VVDSSSVRLRTTRRETPDAQHLAMGLQEFVYGTLTVLVAIGGLTVAAEPPGAEHAIAVIGGVAVATMLAHSFSALVAHHIVHARPVRRREALEELGRSWRVVVAALPSIAVFLIAETGLYGGRTALRVSTLLALLALLAVALVASRRSHSGWFGTTVFMALATGMGLVIVAIEVYVHHL